MGPAPASALCASSLETNGKHTFALARGARGESPLPPLLHAPPHLLEGREPLLQCLCRLPPRPAPPRGPRKGSPVEAFELSSQKFRGLPFSLP
jgi:hypothetical protein